MLREPLERYFGADVDNGGFRCPLPGHEGNAFLEVPDDDPESDLRLLCCHGRWRSLGEVRASIGYGTDDGGRPYERGGRSNIEIATWLRRLLYEAGCFEPLTVRLREIPPTARDHVVKAREGFGLLVGLRWADGPQREVPFAVRFCAAWSGVSFRAALVAIPELKRLGVIEESGRRGGTRYFLPAGVTASRDISPSTEEGQAWAA